jgi:hypothetical protein
MSWRLVLGGARKLEKCEKKNKAADGSAKMSDLGVNEYADLVWSCRN